MKKGGRGDIPGPAPSYVRLCICIVRLSRTVTSPEETPCCSSLNRPITRGAGGENPSGMSIPPKYTCNQMPPSMMGYITQRHMCYGSMSTHWLERINKISPLPKQRGFTEVSTCTRIRRL